ERLRIGRFVRPTPLLFQRAAECVAARHPFPRRDLAEDDSVEMRLAVVNRQRTARLLGQVGRGSPDDEGFVLKLGLLGASGEQLSEGGEESDYEYPHENISKLLA